MYQIDKGANDLSDSAGRADGAGAAGAAEPEGGLQRPARRQEVGLGSWQKFLIIILVILLIFGLMAYGCGRFAESAADRLTGRRENSDYVFDHDYVGLLCLKGTISKGDSADGYNQGWILQRIAQMQGDSRNKGILLSVDTPGGSAYATAELYQALLGYKRETGRPLYVYMGSQATSGGYYVSVAADRIYASPECWTGSIGVIVGTMYDYSGLLDKLGIKAYSITSGPNKDMGAEYKPMTDEQLGIMQGLVDDAYGRFVQAVAEGRGMDEAEVRKLADGRIYTAAQARENGLIDEEGSLEDCEQAMLDDVSAGLDGDLPFEKIDYIPQRGIADLLGLISDAGKTQYSDLMELVRDSDTVRIEYLSRIQK